MAMILPIIKYGSIAWWPRTTSEACKKSLSKMQRMACMSITGAFKTTPTAAMEMLLNIIPLHTVIQMEALKSIKRLTDAGLSIKNMMDTLYKKLSISPHLRNILEMRSDKSKPNLVFHRNFKTLIPTREEWQQGLSSQTNNNRQIWYTDGSKMTSGTGAGVHGENCNLSISLGNFATVFQSEVYAIVACTQEIINMKTKGKDIYILSDSQAAIKALAAFKVNSGIVLNCIKNLNKIGLHNKVRLIWVPGHEGIAGNEKADELARKGSEATPIGPEPFIGLSAATVITAINEWAKDRQLKEWKTIPGLIHSKAFITDDIKCWGAKIKYLSKDNIRKLIGVFTGHYGTNYTLNKIGVTSDPKCRHCEEEAETMKHVLCECDRLARTRMNLLGIGYPKPEDYRLLPKERIARFVKIAVPSNE